eukprot:Plantae.Rhodophyta-Purpureofilum_apyrenoidigerum.ctg617.p2 GENE.Plantae.Rhodophyta-Purpureofilum_apyrenoidigerum.ctg617~~Plantae.Rhodophyta-Purpureofilum_apyrenoidigerum.ctg617.p2  ORF type:complete len:238 (-),score=35.01 Plantae.Rhodophyta-Purpureofilum_apyrenoidigerum.ctg617:1152-1787(-)
MVTTETVAVVVTGVAAVTTGVYAYLGGLRNVEVVRSRTPFVKKTVLYKCFFGSYSNLSQWFKEICCVLEGIKCPIIGIYYDDPRELKKRYGSDDKARTLLSVCIDDAPADKREELRKKFEEKGFREKELIGGEAAEADFRLRGGLLRIPSILVYAAKVYPQIETFRQKNGLPPSGVLEYNTGFDVRCFTPYDKAVADDWLLPEIVERDALK